MIYITHSKLLNFILFADDTNLFYSHSDIKYLFNIVNQELKLISKWFKENKLSLNFSKTKYTLFCKANKTDNIPLKLPFLNINNVNINREDNMKFLGVILDESLTWKKHIQTIETKIYKNLEVSYIKLNHT